MRYGRLCIGLPSKIYKFLQPEASPVFSKLLSSCYWPKELSFDVRAIKFKNISSTQALFRKVFYLTSSTYGLAKYHMRVVMKFGGSAIDSANKINNVAELIRKYKFCNDLSDRSNHDNDIVVVISALRGMTDNILSVCENIKKGLKRADL